MGLGKAREAMVVGRLLPAHVTRSFHGDDRRASAELSRGENDTGQTAVRARAWRPRRRALRRVPLRS